MTRAIRGGRVKAAALAVLTLGAGCGWFGDGLDEAAVDAPPVHPSFLYGRVTTTDGDTYEGRIRFGGNQEAFWSDYFNGYKAGNSWVSYVPARVRRAWRHGFSVFGIDIRLGYGNQLERQYMARFGDIARLEARGRDLRVTLRNGTVIELDRYSADDYADGVRVWDARHGVVDLKEGKVRRIEFLPSTGAGATQPYRLHGTVRTRDGEFTGFLQWGPRGAIALDELAGEVDGDARRVPFATIRSITRLSDENARVTLLDGSELVMSGTRNRGIFVDDARYGRVLVSWDAFEHADLTPVGAEPGGGPTYADYAPGRPLTGRVTTRSGRQFEGRLVYDLDESETTETLDAPSRGVQYTIPFELIASIRVASDVSDGRARVTLRSGEAVELERDGDLGKGNLGLLIFTGGADRPAFVPWSDVVQVEFASPAA